MPGTRTTAENKGKRTAALGFFVLFRGTRSNGHHQGREHSAQLLAPKKLRFTKAAEFNGNILNAQHKLVFKLRIILNMAPQIGGGHSIIVCLQLFKISTQGLHNPCGRSGILHRAQQCQLLLQAFFQRRADAQYTFICCGYTTGYATQSNQNGGLLHAMNFRTELPRCQAE